MKAGGKKPAISDWGWRVFRTLQLQEAGVLPGNGVPLLDPKIKRGAGELVAQGLAKLLQNGKVKLAVPNQKSPRVPVRQLRRPEDPAFAFGHCPSCPDDDMS